MTTRENTFSIQNAKVLLVEDHQNMAETIVDFLEVSGFVVDYAADGITGLYLASSQPFDAIILDVMLPGMDGFEICRKLRQEKGITVPILMLTARDELNDKLTGFQHGADDYLVKPFDLPELVARLIAQIRRNRGEHSSELLTVGDLTLDSGKMEVRRHNQLIHLSPTCYRILKILMREAPNVVSREEIENELWGDLPPDSDTIRSHMYKLRKAVEKPFDSTLIRTVQGAGFRISEE